MKQCYLDNASTTRIKPPDVYQAIVDTMQNNGCSPSRGSYDCALQAGRKIFSARSTIARLFNVADSRYVVFTPGVTWSLNMAILGLLNNGDHVITTTMEHNAVARPLRIIERDREINVTWVQSNCFGQVSPCDIESAINPLTKMIVINHASNIIGTIIPLADIAEIAHKHQVMLVVDCAQTAGFCDIDFRNLELDVLAFTGHKALFGPPGTGGMVLSEKAAQLMRPIIAGGTGSNSAIEYQPDMMPDKFESGTQNAPGFAGLGAGVEFVLEKGLPNIRTHEHKLLGQLIDGFNSINGITLYHAHDEAHQVPTISITVDGLDIGEASMVLDERYGIMTRSGIHCAPLAHRTIGTYPNGTIRFSIGYFNTLEDIDYAIACMKEIALEKNRV